MRTFLRDHWKAIVVILLLVALATFTVTPGAAPAGKAEGGSDEHTHR